jgi:hypothetical protein
MSVTMMVAAEGEQATKQCEERTSYGYEGLEHGGNECGREREADDKS